MMTFGRFRDSGLVLITLVLLAAAAADAGRPNILFVFTDDHGSQALSAYGSTINQTPNMDRLAREGMLFRNCLVTNSICGPSHSVRHAAPALSICSPHLACQTTTTQAPSLGFSERANFDSKPQALAQRCDSNWEPAFSRL